MYVFCTLMFLCLFFFFFFFFFFFSSRRRHTRWTGDWSSDVCSSDLGEELAPHLHVALLDASELDVDVLPVRIGFLTGESEVEVGRVGFILPVMEPLVDVGLGHAASYYGATL